MTFAFLVRRGYVKVIGSVIQAALDRGHRAVLLWDPDEAKAGERMTEAEVRETWPSAVPVVYRRGPLGPALASHDARALVAPSLHYLLRVFGREPEIPALRAAGVRLYSLDYLFETLKSDPDGYAAIDVTFYTSAFERQRHWELRQARFGELGVDRAARSAVCGSTLMDQLDLVDRAAIRKRYGFAPDQPVVVLMTLKLVVQDGGRRRLLWGDGAAAIRAARAVVAGHPEWAREILGANWYRDTARAIRRWCDRHGAALVMKSREKNEDPGFLRDLGDVFVYDEGLYPYTSMELMAIADLCVHFQSGAALEAAFAGVPSLNVTVSQDHLVHYASEHALDEIYSGRPGSLLNFPGVVWPVAPAYAVARFDGLALDELRVDPGARRAYVEKFLGFDDTRSGVRVVETIERAGPGR
jgi:hypothetical protein